MYEGEWWTTSRPREAVERMLDNSDIIVAFEDLETAALVAFSRILTDYSFKALIFDVIVRRDLRGSGLGRRLLDAICMHPDLAGVRHLELYCKADMIPLYERWGFTADLGDLTFMRLTR